MCWFQAVFQDDVLRTGSVRSSQAELGGQARRGSEVSRVCLAPAPSVTCSPGTLVTTGSLREAHRVCVSDPTVHLLDQLSDKTTVQLPCRITSF